jgi:hypothetical protein
VTARHDALFAEHGSPEAIQARLVTARAAVRKAQRRVVWLEELLARRTAEKAAGMWPPIEGPR